MSAENRILRVDPTRCTGVGICARVAGEMIELDRWGFPIIDNEFTISPRRLARAVRACPRAALFVDERPASGRA